jgi:hypothetical protein
MGNFISYQYGIKNADMEKFFNKHSLPRTLWGITLLPCGHGHYSLTSYWVINESDVAIKRTITDMRLVDAWKSGMDDLYEDGDDGFDNWGEVINTMLYATGILDL